MALGNMSGGEMMGGFAFASLVLTTLTKFFLKIFDRMAPPKLTTADIEDMKWKTNLEGVLDETRKLLEKMNDKGDERAKTLDTIHDRGTRDHERIKQTQTSMETLSTLYATTKFCNQP